MLNISQKEIKEHSLKDKCPNYHKVERKTTTKRLRRFIFSQLILVIIIMFLPWTQNIQTDGYLTALTPEQRPQTIQAPIPGKIEQWFVKEGDFVKKGDTIILISEIKTQYLDSNLVPRTQSQLQAKLQMIKFYEEKVKALDNQINALTNAMQLKLQQARNKVLQKELKVKSDSANLEAAKINYEIAKYQYERMQKLYEQGLKSLTKLEKRKQTMQKNHAYFIQSKNKLLTSRNELINAKIYLNNIKADYESKISKAKSDKNSALSNLYKTRAEVLKLQNTLTNYSVRSQMHYITAPQSGYITKAIRVGIGEVVKAGEKIVMIVPEKYELAVEMYVKPLDLPLLEKGQKVRIQFDGWPAIVFSGWPNLSYGTYGGRVFAIDRFISPNGKYRVLVAQDPNDHPWPDALRPGSGTRNILLLKTVPIWYELWRKFNGFPPDFYKKSPTINKDKKKDKK